MYSQISNRNTYIFLVFDFMIKSFIYCKVETLSKNKVSFTQFLTMINVFNFFLFSFGISKYYYFCFMPILIYTLSDDLRNVLINKNKLLY